MENDNPVVTKNPAPPCGLYCAICTDWLNNICHGCSCKCGKCIGLGHYQHCRIIKCATNRDIESCCNCMEFPCTQLIEFANDPIWTTHSRVIENLKRQKKIGKEKWIEEQEEYWKNPDRLFFYCHLGEQCSAKYTEWKKQLARSKESEK